MTTSIGRRLARRTMVGLAVAAGAMALSAPAASAQAQTTSCSAVSLVRPLLGAPACVTPPLACPADSLCGYSGRAVATTLIGLGPSAGRVQLFGTANNGAALGPAGNCSGQPSGCTATVGPIAVVGQATGQARAACAWTAAQSLGVLAGIRCELVRTNVITAPQGT
ncbi:hypothetical protein [Conexibacter sp. SYSU D00693]|uniref:hypothetical protein n=1 Tax=Conexibacter sp. SYSU D00693 TaxID=2812560 RepID=UPI00196A54A5|nr:hypothetical protein [Conexibacter sp. SYSU D00693]